MAENKYQARLIKRILKNNPTWDVLKNDPNLRQGIPDLTIYSDTGKFGMLETKDSLDADYQPNQEYYIKHFNALGFAAMICPENEEEVLCALQEALGS